MRESLLTVLQCWRIWVQRKLHVSSIAEGISSALSFSQRGVQIPPLEKPVLNPVEKESARSAGRFGSAAVGRRAFARRIISGESFAGVTKLLGRLSSRERYFVGAAGVASIAILLSTMIIDPLWEMHGRLRLRVAAKERELREVATLATSYDTLRRALESTRPVSQANLSPFAFLEGLTTSTLGRDKLAAISPVGREEHSGIAREIIELKLSSVSLQELVELLYKIDTAGTPLQCIQLSLKKRYKDPYTFDVTLTTVSLDVQ